MYLPTAVLVQVVRDSLEAATDMPSENIDLMNSLAAFVGERVTDERNAYEVAYALAKVQGIPHDWAIITSCLSLLTFRSRCN